MRDEEVSTLCEFNITNAVWSWYFVGGEVVYHPMDLVIREVGEVADWVRVDHGVLIRILLWWGFEECLI